MVLEKKEQLILEVDVSQALDDACIDRLLEALKPSDIAGIIEIKARRTTINYSVNLTRFSLVILDSGKKILDVLDRSIREAFARESISYVIIYVFDEYNK